MIHECLMQGGALIGTGGQTSGLLAPIMALEGHQGEIFAVKFHPEGQYLASSGFDRQICKYYTECVCQS